MASKTSGISLVGRPLESSTGYGLMGLTWRAKPPSQEQAFAAMKEALRNGANFWNGGELYGNVERNSLHLLREYFTKYPEDADRVIISIKGSGPNGLYDTIDSSATNVSRSIEQCLKVLDGTKKLDIWEMARLSPDVPIEQTVRAAQKYIDAGQLGGLSLSEVSADTIRRAAAVGTVVAVEVEVSLWSTEIFTNGIAAACAEHNIPIVAYSPLGRGFLTGEIKRPEDIPEGDMRRHMPRFQGENFEKNLKLVKEVEKIAERKGCKPGQVGLAWVKAKSGNGNPTLIPIPGATTVARVAENTHNVELSKAEVEEIDHILSSVSIEGGRYADAAAHTLLVDTVKES